MNHAQYQNSERLQRLLDLMLDGQPRTTLDIINGARICAVNSAVCELRENGFNCLCIKKTSPAVYQLMDIDAAYQRAVELLDKKEAA